MLKYFRNELLLKNDVDSKMVSYVGMGQHVASSKDKPVLFTDGLADCIGFVATTNDFAFLAHLSDGSWNEKWSTVNDKPIVEVLSCKAIHDLRDDIGQIRNNINMPVKIMVVLGSRPYDENSKYRVCLETEIQNLIRACRNLGIIIKRSPNENSTAIWVDSRIGKIIFNKNTLSKNKPINLTSEVEKNN